jgi:hypothetical protein
MGLIDAGAKLPAQLKLAKAIDVDCDGVKELAYFGGGANSWAYRFDPISGWQHAKNLAGAYVYDAPPVAAGVSAAAIQEVGPVPGSLGSCPLLLVAQDGGYSGAFLADAQQGWQVDAAHNPENLSPPIIIADKNGKGYPVKIADNTALHQIEIVASWATDAW